MEQARVARSDYVVEIGGGTGVLTLALARRAQGVTTIEIDERLAARLRRTTAEHRSVEVVTGDALTVGLPQRPFRVVANLPFNRTADLVRLIASESWVEQAHLVVQLEAAERFAGSPYARETLRSLELKPWWHVEIMGELPAAAFAPRPATRTALLWMSRHVRPLLADAEAPSYRALLGRIFGHGQILRSSLGREVTAEQLRRLASRLRIPLDGRPGDLTFDQWLAVQRFVTSRAGTPLTRVRWQGNRPGRNGGRARRRTRGSAGRSRPPGPRSPRADR